MGVSLYDSADLTNEVIIDNSFTNASNIGGPDPNVNLTGSIVDNAVSFPGTSTNATRESSASVQLQYDIDHSSPINPVPNNARITKVTITMQTASPSASGDASITFPNEGPGSFKGGQVSATAEVTAIVAPSPINTATLGTLSFILANQNNNSAGGAGLQAASAAENPAAIIIGYTIDFTTNPGGLFPAGYATYAEFIANFAQMTFQFTFLGEAVAQWVSFSPPDHPTPATGSLSGSGTLVANNFSMEVDWFVPLQWTVSPSTLTLPDNTITISRPDPGVSPDDDTQIIQTLQINGQTILPTDPSVIIWLRFLIIIHLMPDMIVSGSLPIDAILIGTQFSGSVNLGSVTIITADLSGIYTFDTTTHHDTLYARSTGTTAVTTQSVAIPAPFFITAFFHDDDEEIMHYAGVRMRVTGQGTLKQIFYSLDYINTDTLADLTLKTANNTQPFTISNFIDQDAALKVFTQSTDDYMAVSKLIIYMNPIATGWPQ